MSLIPRLHLISLLILTLFFLSQNVLLSQTKVMMSETFTIRLRSFIKGNVSSHLINVIPRIQNCFLKTILSAKRDLPCGKMGSSLSMVEHVKSSAVLWKTPKMQTAHVTIKISTTAKSIAVVPNISPSLMTSVYPWTGAVNTLKAAIHSVRSVNVIIRG